ncbi:MAG: hypothetical protein C4296_10705 [Gemmataceae bacterium]
MAQPDGRPLAVALLAPRAAGTVGVHLALCQQRLIVKLHPTLPLPARHHRVRPVRVAYIGSVRLARRIFLSVHDRKNQLSLRRGPAHHRLGLMPNQGTDRHGLAPSDYPGLPAARTRRVQPSGLDKGLQFCFVAPRFCSPYPEQRTCMLAKWTPYVLAIVCGCTLVAAPWWYFRYQRHHVRHFRLVEPSVLYRSGQMTQKGLQRLVYEYGIRTIVTLRDRDDYGDLPSDWEEKFCRERGIVFVRIKYRECYSEEGPAPIQETIRDFLAVMRDSERYPRPVLLHCFAGEHRTGVLTAIYRMEMQGWPREAAISEMKIWGYDNFENEADVRGFLRSYEPGSWARHAARACPQPTHPPQ